MRRGNEGDSFALAEIELEIARAPRVADRCVSALLLEEVWHVLRHFGVKRERRLVITQTKHQGRHRCVERRFEISAACDQHRRCRERVVNRRFVRTCVKVRANSQPEGFDRARHRIGHDDGVLQARHEQLLLDGGAIELIGPDGQPTHQPEARGDLVGPASPSAQPPNLPTRQPDAFVEPRHEHDAPEWSRQRRDQKRVVAARQHTAQRPRRISAEAVRHQPLERRQSIQIGADLDLANDVCGYVWVGIDADHRADRSSRSQGRCPLARLAGELLNHQLE